MSANKHQNRNLAARMGRWSAAHWKTATFGWLALVVVAFGLGGQIGTKQIDPNAKGPGESGRMDKILDAARAARTESDQKANYVKFQVLALQDPPGVIPYVINHVNAYRKNVKKDAALSQGVAFFAFLRNLTCDGFYTSKIGIADLQYIGNTALREFPGCPPPPES